MQNQIEVKKKLIYSYLFLTNMPNVQHKDSEKVIILSYRDWAFRWLWYGEWTVPKPKHYLVIWCAIAVKI